MTGLEREPKNLEFPRGSGRIATYSPDEHDFLRPFYEEALRYPPGHPVRVGRERDCRVLHELKVEFGLDLLGEQVGTGEDDAA